MQRHQWLQILRVQQLPVVGVILQREPVADAVVLNLPDFASVLLFLGGAKQTNMGSYRTARAQIIKKQNKPQANLKNIAIKPHVYLVGAVDGDDVGLHLCLSLFRDGFIRGWRLKKKTSFKNRKNPSRPFRTRCNNLQGGGSHDTLRSDHNTVRDLRSDGMIM